ncbi:helix-turn-helix domain-containing protein [Modestobacter sp. VKM Ac-2985]|uniref:helix-turn-helix domain-containing protein n=1 Tax=Modestobacter sp. VKM Ac-2985 TaxID=3004139 RepID=UPI003FA55B7D
MQAEVEAFVRDEYAAGRSLREIAELTGRSHSAVRNILDKHGVERRPVGATGLAIGRDTEAIKNKRPS